MSSSVAKPELDDVVAELAPVGLLELERFLELCWGNALLLEKQLANSDSHFRLVRWTHSLGR